MSSAPSLACLIHRTSAQICSVVQSGAFVTHSSLLPEQRTGPQAEMPLGSPGQMSEARAKCLKVAPNVQGRRQMSQAGARRQRPAPNVWGPRQMSEGRVKCPKPAPNGRSPRQMARPPPIAGTTGGYLGARPSSATPSCFFAPGRLDLETRPREADTCLDHTS